MDARAADEDLIVSVFRDVLMITPTRSTSWTCRQAAVSVAAALIRSGKRRRQPRLMGSNMQRQAVPLVAPRRRSSYRHGRRGRPRFGAAIAARRTGVIDQVDARVSSSGDGRQRSVEVRRRYLSPDEVPALQPETCINQRRW